MSYEALIAENKALKEELAQVNHQLKELLRLIHGSKSERYKPEDFINQPGLFEDEPEPIELPVPETKEVISQRKKKQHNGRNELPEHLPVVEVIIEPEEDITGLKKIGEVITESLEYTPGSLVKKRIIRYKYANPEDETQGIIIAPLPVRPIDKSIAEASLLAHILVNKFVDHLPYYRQIQMFKRDFDWEVSSSTINDWMAACCTLMEPLYPSEQLHPCKILRH